MEQKWGAGEILGVRSKWATKPGQLPLGLTFARAKKRRCEGLRHFGLRMVGRAERRAKPLRQLNKGAGARWPRPPWYSPPRRSGTRLFWFLSAEGTRYGRPAG